jgi:hypothetical protein
MTGEGGGSNDAAGPIDASLPAVDPSALMPSLSDADLGKICSWMFPGELGGYGAVVKCYGVSGMVLKQIQNPANQGECVSNIRFAPGGCTMTVAQWEACVEAQVPSMGCSYPDPACTPFFYCHMLDQ